MSESAPTTAKPSPQPFIIVNVITSHARAVKALAATSADSLDHTTVHTSYEKAINLARTLHSGENLTNQFTTLVTETEDLVLKRDAAIADHNALTARVVQLEAPLMQTLSLTTATTNSSSASCKV
jgi:hypothetical protein